MPFFRVTVVIESNLESEDDLHEELVDRRIGKHKITEIEDIILDEDYEPSEYEEEDDDKEDES